MELKNKKNKSISNDDIIETKQENHKISNISLKKEEDKKEYNAKEKIFDL